VQASTEKTRQELEALIPGLSDFSEAHAALATVYYRLKRKQEGDRDGMPPARSKQKERRTLASS